jgi:hypothetical protein
VLLCQPQPDIHHAHTLCPPTTRTPAAEQRDVEAYFRARNTMPRDFYWHGVTREGPGSTPQLLDGTPLVDYVSSADPYAHWDWSLQVGLGAKLGQAARRTSSPAC